MPAPTPKPRKVAEIKSYLLRPSLTSQYQCWFNPPQQLRDLTKKIDEREDKSNTRTFLEQKVKAGVTEGYDENLFSLSCVEASLPGSSLATHELNNDFTGVTERHAYRRLYDDRADFTFYVNHDHNVITFFETWMSYIVNEQYALGLETQNYNYRVNYPNLYRTEIYLHKFEKDYQGRFLQYRFLQAYPISITSMPVSYDNSQLLKCTVSFTYTRYIINRIKNTDIVNDTDNAIKSNQAQSSGNVVGSPDEQVEYGNIRKVNSSSGSFLPQSGS